MVLARRDATGLLGWNPGFTRKMYSDDAFTERLVAEASPLQRALMGFPYPGDASWTAAGVEAVAARFGPLGFDATPYRDALPPHNPIRTAIYRRAQSYPKTAAALGLALGSGVAKVGLALLVA